MPRASRHTARRSRASPLRTALTATGIVLLIAVFAAGVWVYFTGWNWFLGDPATPVHEVHEQTFLEPENPPELIPDGSAAENLPFFTEILREYATGSSPIRGEPVVEALAEAGFDTADMQVSFDRTKTDLVADNIFVSVRIGADCLIGQLTTGDRDVYAAAEPAVGPDRSLCLIGKTRAIDW